MRKYSEYAITIASLLILLASTGFVVGIACGVLYVFAKLGFNLVS